MERFSVAKYNLFYQDKDNIFLHCKKYNIVFKKENNVFLAIKEKIEDLKKEKKLYYRKLKKSSYPKITIYRNNIFRCYIFDLTETSKLLKFLNNFDFPQAKF
jgi:hypothetical protein